MNNKKIYFQDTGCQKVTDFFKKTLCCSAFLCMACISEVSGQSYPTWTQVTRLVLDGATMTKYNSQSAWVAGAISEEYTEGDGWIEFSFGSNRYAQMGLSHFNTSTAANFDYAIFAHLNTYLCIRENGILLPNIGKGKQVSVRYTPADTLRVERIGTTILYKKNGVTFYTSTISSSGQLHVDCSFNQYLSSIVVRNFELGTQWTGAVNQDWEDPGNWSANRVPGATDHVTINACATCPVLSGSVSIGALNMRAGSSLTLGNHTLSVKNSVSVDSSQIASSRGEIRANDFNDVRGSTFSGLIILKKTGGTANNWYGGNYFSPEVQFVNESSQLWKLSEGANNVVQGVLEY